MKPLTQFSRSIITISSAAALILMGGMGQLAAASEGYEGQAVLCAIDNTNATQEAKGSGSIACTCKQAMLFRIDADDNDLMHGWETHTSITNATANGGGYTWDEAVLIPDGYKGSATLEDSFRFPLKQAEKIQGSYLGTGALEGVNVEYALTRSALTSLSTTACEGMPWGECIPPACMSFAGSGAGYFISGRVSD